MICSPLKSSPFTMSANTSEYASSVFSVTSFSAMYLTAFPVGDTWSAVPYEVFSVRFVHSRLLSQIRRAPAAAIFAVCPPEPHEFGSPAATQWLRRHDKTVLVSYFSRAETYKAGICLPDIHILSVSEGGYNYGCVIDRQARAVIFLNGCRFPVQLRLRHRPAGPGDDRRRQTPVLLYIT